MADDQRPDDWRDHWLGTWLTGAYGPEPEASYYAGFFDETSRLRRNEGRFVGTSPVEREALSGS